jgi:hypothetical protein
VIGSLNEQEEDQVELELPSKEQMAENLRIKPESNLDFK